MLFRGQKDDVRCEDYSRGGTEASLRPSAKPDHATASPGLYGCKSNGEAGIGPFKLS